MPLAPALHEKSQIGMELATKSSGCWVRMKI